MPSSDMDRPANNPSRQVQSPNVVANVTMNPVEIILANARLLHPELRIVGISCVFEYSQSTRHYRCSLVVPPGANSGSRIVARGDPAFTRQGAADLLLRVLERDMHTYLTIVEDLAPTAQAIHRDAVDEDELTPTRRLETSVRELTRAVISASSSVRDMMSMVTQLTTAVQQNGQRPAPTQPNTRSTGTAGVPGASSHGQSAGVQRATARDGTAGFPAPTGQGNPAAVQWAAGQAQRVLAHRNTYSQPQAGMDPVPPNLNQNQPSVALPWEQVNAAASSAQHGPHHYPRQVPTSAGETEQMSAVVHQSYHAAGQALYAASTTYQRGHATIQNTAHAVERIPSPNLPMYQARSPSPETQGWPAPVPIATPQHLVFEEPDWNGDQLGSQSTSMAANHGEVSPRTTRTTSSETLLEQFTSASEPLTHVTEPRVVLPPPRPGNVRAPATPRAVTIEQQHSAIEILISGASSQASATIAPTNVPTDELPPAAGMLVPGTAARSLQYSVHIRYTQSDPGYLHPDSPHPELVSDDGEDDEEDDGDLYATPPTPRQRHSYPYY